MLSGTVYDAVRFQKDNSPRGKLPLRCDSREMLDEKQ
jgi:hypothetical protein